MAVSRCEEAHFAAASDRVAHRQRLGGRCRFVEQRSVRERETGEIRNHRLKVQQRFESTLGDFGLVRRVLRIPTGAFEDIALDHRWHDDIGVSHPDTGANHLVARGDLAEALDQLELARRRTFEPRERQRFVEAYRRRDRVVGQLIEIKLRVPDDDGGPVVALPRLAAELAAPSAPAAAADPPAIDTDEEW